MRGQLQSHNKDGNHTIRSTIAEYTMLHRSFMAPGFIEPELLPSEVLHRRNRDYLCCSCDLDLDLMTFIYEPQLYSLQTYHMCEHELPMSKVIV